MYSDTYKDEKIYTKFLNKNEDENQVLSSLVERCHNESNSVRNDIQSHWVERVQKAIEPIAADNPYLSTINVGDEVPAVSAVAWVQGSRGLDCRPKLFDNESKTWKLCDTGSMVTVIKKSKEDKIDNSKILQAVNGSPIKCYGQKEVTIRINRKAYKILATIADVDQDIIGWDFISKHKLGFDWSEFGDLVICDKRAKIRATLKCVAIPSHSRIHSLVNATVDSTGAEAFEVASMRLLTGDEVTKTDIQPKYQKLLNEFPEILEPSFKDLSTKHGVLHTIPTTGKPCKAKLRPLMANSEKAIKGKQAWDEMVRLGVVERVSADQVTEYSSPLHLVPKPDGSMRPCSDFRQLNSQTLTDSFPLPHIKTFSHKLHGAKVFSKLDLQAAFHNVVIDPKDVKKTTTLTPWGVFVYKRMAFGLCDAPATFSRLIETVLAGIDGLFTYLDDLLVYAPDEETHYNILKQIFQRLKENGLSLNVPKCQFGQKSVDYLGYIVSKEGITPMKQKVSHIEKLSPPKSQKDLLHFLGAIGYYRSSLKGIKTAGKYENPSEIMQVLFNLATCKLPPKTKFLEIWHQDKRIAQAFQKTKQMLVDSVTLTHPDPEAELALSTDASDFAIGGVLEQRGRDGRFHPLGFFSKHLGVDKHKWSTYRKELFACVQSLRHFLPMFYGRHITIYSDHAPLTKSFASNSLQTNDPVAQRQLVEIGMFTKDVKYVSAKENLMADWLSRKTDEALIGEAYKLEKNPEMENVRKEELVDFFLLPFFPFPRAYVA